MLCLLLLLFLVLHLKSSVSSLENVEKSTNLTKDCLQKTICFVSFALCMTGCSACFTLNVTCAIFSWLSEFLTLAAYLKCLRIPLAVIENNILTNDLIVNKEQLLQ